MTTPPTDADLIDLENYHKLMSSAESHIICRLIAEVRRLRAERTTIRAAALEEAAQVCKNWEPTEADPGVMCSASIVDIGASLAQVIRRLKEKQ